MDFVIPFGKFYRVLMQA